MFNMARTNRDMQLKYRIEQIIKQFKDKPDKELIYILAGHCGISHRTASEHFNAFKAQQTLKESGFVEKCGHEWSSFFCTPGGLVKECKLCRKTEFAKIKNEI